MVQDASLSLEDAVALGNFLSRVTRKKQIPYLLDAYQEARQPRAISMVDSEKLYRQLLFVSEGNASDAGLRTAAQTWTVSLLTNAVWKDVGSIYLHDANGEAELWWYHWGSLLGGAEESDAEGESPVENIKPDFDTSPALMQPRKSFSFGQQDVAFELTVESTSTVVSDVKDAHEWQI